MEHEGDSDTNYNWCTWNDPQRLGKKAGKVGNPNYSIAKIGQNTEKSTGDLRRLAATQTMVKEPSANTGVKNSQGVKIIIIIMIIIIAKKKVWLMWFYASHGTWL